MAYLIDQINEFEIMKASRGYLVKNTNGKYKNHSHFKTEKTCRLAIDIVINKQIPQSAYLLSACQRLSLDDRYVEQLKIIENKNKDRQIYRNYNLYPGKYS